MQFICGYYCHSVLCVGATNQVLVPQVVIYYHGGPTDRSAIHCIGVFIKPIPLCFVRIHKGVRILHGYHHKLHYLSLLRILQLTCTADSVGQLTYT